MFVTWKKLEYLSKCVGKSCIHAGCSFSIEDRSLYGNDGLNRHSVLDTNEENSSIHRTHGVGHILFPRPAFKFQ